MVYSFHNMVNLQQCWEWAFRKKKEIIYLATSLAISAELGLLKRLKFKKKQHFYFIITFVVWCWCTRTWALLISVWCVSYCSSLSHCSVDRSWLSASWGNLWWASSRKHPDRSRWCSVVDRALYKKILTPAKHSCTSSFPRGPHLMNYL